MRGNVPAYELIAARDLAHALELLPDYQPLAGGTDLMVLFEAGKLVRTRWQSIWKIAELRGIFSGAEYVTLGALTTYTDVRRDARVAVEFPMLAEAAAQIGGIATQNRGTLGGNIVNASPAADMPPALLVYGAEVELTSVRGSRWIPYAQFHTGYKTMDRAADELLTRIRLPRGIAREKHTYRKVGTRRAQAISKVCFAAVTSGNRVRMGLASVAPTPLLVEATRAEARDALEAALAPIDDIRSTAAYRRQVAINLLAEFLA
jgi:CO/xanthine dehydrogenase FAD-binding subunit